MNQKLDAKDLKIISELDMDARQSIASIARKAGVSKETANYRIRQLQERGIIEGFYAIIDVSRIGFEIHRLVIRFQRMSPEIEKEMISYLKNDKSVGWIVSLHGNWDMAMLFWARNTLEFKQVYDKLLKKYGKYIQKRALSIVTRIRNYKNNYLYGTDDPEEKTIGDAGNIRIDSVDLKILEMLSENSRMPSVEIAGRTGVAPNTVKNRISYLTRHGVIKGFRAKINHSLLGYRHYKVFLNLEDLSQKETVLRFLKPLPNVIYITEAIGESDLEFEAMFQKDEDLNHMLTTLRRECPGLIKDYEIILTYYEHRVNYLPYIS